MDIKELKELDFNEKIEDFIKEFSDEGIYNLEKMKLTGISFWELYENLVLNGCREDWGTERILDKDLYYEYFIDAEIEKYEGGGGSSKAFEYLFLIKDKKVYRWETCCEF